MIVPDTCLGIIREFQNIFFLYIFVKVAKRLDLRWALSRRPVRLLAPKHIQADSEILQTERESLCQVYHHIHCNLDSVGFNTLL